MVSEKCFCLPQHKYLLLLTKIINIILIIILHFFLKVSYGVFQIH